MEGACVTSRLTQVSRQTCFPGLFSTGDVHSAFLSWVELCLLGSEIFYSGFHSAPSLSKARNTVRVELGVSEGPITNSVAMRIGL